MHLLLVSGMTAIGTRGLLLILELLAVTGASQNWGYSVEKFEESPGFYYVDKGTVKLYDTMWKTIVYVDLKAEDLEVDTLGSYINHADRLCNSVEVKNWTACSQFRESVTERFNYLRKSEGVLRDVVGTKSNDFGPKRGILNFVGEISKILFGTLDDRDADYYDEQIRKFEKNSDDTTDLLKQQVCVVRSTFSVFNATLGDVAHNDGLVRKELADIQTYLDTLSGETARTFDTFEAKLAIEKHITQVNTALTVLQRNIDLVLDSVLHAQAGHIQPQIVPLTLLLEALRESQSFFPRDTVLPFSLSKDSANLIYKVCEMQIYLQNNRLSYVVGIPLVNKGEFKVYQLVTVPILVNKNKLVYIRSAEPLLCVDWTRQYYYFSSDRELQACKDPSRKRYVCKQGKPLLSSLVQEECAVRLLQGWKTLPSSCDVNYVQLTHSVDSG